MATAPSPNDLTRQQLDELDALLQRMLSVPLSPADTPMPAGALPAPTPPASPGWRADAPAPAAAPLPHVQLPDPPSSVALQPAVSAPPVPAPKPAPPAPKPAPAPPPVAAAPTPKPVPKPPAPAPAPPPPKAAAPVAVPAPPPAPASESAAPPVAIQFLPFVLLNVIFDFVCGLFGPPGRLLRSGFFKHLYGLAGLALLAYTAAHVAQDRGWLTLPVQLPWPPPLR
jgi:hypothetical protein